MNPIIETKGITKSFFVGSREPLQVLKGIDLTIEREKLTMLKGRSGSGKTTLLNILSMLDDPSAGSLMIDGKDMRKASQRKREMYRRQHMGFVFQNVALIPFLSAYENVNFALKLADSKCDRKQRITELMAAVGLEDRMHHMPSQMSGGEQQRVAIARAVAHKPDIVFADEPTGALDTSSGIAVMNLFQQLIRSEGITLVMTTHDPGLMKLGDVVYEMEDGVLKHVDEIEGSKADN